MRKLFTCPYYEEKINGLKTFMLKDEFSDAFVVSLSLPFGANMKEYVVDGISLKSGLAHFLEHRLFDSINGEVSNLCLKHGITYNAATGREYTTYYLIGKKKSLKFALKILFDMFFFIKRNDEQLLIEQSIILSEKEQDNDDVYEKLNAKIEENFLKNTHLEHSIIGSVTDIKSINYDDLILAHEAFYNLNNAIFVISGNFKRKDVVDFINDYKFPEPKKHEIKFKPCNMELVSKDLNIKEKNIQIPMFTFLISFENDFKNKYPLIEIYLELLNDLLSFDKRVDELKSKGMINDELEFDYYLSEEINQIEIVSSSNQFLKNELVKLLDNLKNNVTQEYIDYYKNEKRTSRILNFSSYENYKTILNTMFQTLILFNI